MKYAAIALLALAITVSGCMAPNGPASSADFQLYASSDGNGIQAFDSLNATFSEVSVQPANLNATDTGNATGNASNQSVPTIPVDATVDLTQVQGENATLITELSMPPGMYESIALNVSNVSAEMGGENVNVTAPQEGLMIERQFNVTANETTQFVFDIAVEETEDGYVLVPAPETSGVAGEDVNMTEVVPGQDNQAGNDTGILNGTGNLTNNTSQGNLTNETLGNLTDSTNASGQ